jgi:hypothetical protein
MKNGKKLYYLKDRRGSKEEPVVPPSWLFGPTLDKNLLPSQIKYVRMKTTYITDKGQPETKLYIKWDLESEIESNTQTASTDILNFVTNKATNPKTNYLMNWRYNPYGSIYHILKEGDTLPTEPQPSQLNVPLNKAGDKVIQRGNKYMLVNKRDKPITPNILDKDTNEVDINSLYVLVDLDAQNNIEGPYDSYFVPISKVYLKSDGNPVTKNVSTGSGIDAGSRIMVSFRPEYNKETDRVTLKSLHAIAAYPVIPDGRKDKKVAGRKRTVRKQRRQRLTRRYLK